VPYPAQCLPAVCKNDANQRTPLQLGRQITLTLAKFVKSKCAELQCKPPSLALQEYMFAFEVSRPPIRELCFIVRLAFANAQSGPKKAFQGFIVFEPTQEIPCECPSDSEFRFGNVCLRPAYQPFVESVRSSASPGRGFLDPFGVGAVLSLTNDELVDKILATLTILTTHELQHTSIIISMLKHCPLPSIEEPFGRKCLGLDCSWGPVHLSPNSRAAAPVRPVVAIESGLAAIDDDDFAVLPSASSAPKQQAPQVLSAEEHDFLMLCGDGEFAEFDDAVIDEDRSDSGQSWGTSESDESDADVEFDDSVLDELCTRPTMVGESQAPPSRPKTAFDLHYEEFGFVEYQHHLHLRNASGEAGQKVGQVQFLTGKSFSFKAICSHPAHQSAAASSSSTLPAPQQRRGKRDRDPCYLMLSANCKVNEIHRMCVQWLRDGLESTHQEHDTLASEARESVKR
jgi:hypothetical protein